MRFLLVCSLFSLFVVSSLTAQDKRPREYGIEFGVLPVGKNNAITDVPGVEVGQVTVIRGDSVQTGVTAVLPYRGNIFMQKVPAAIYLGNGFGKLAGYSQVEELGNIETPILLTNTLNVPIVANAVMDYILQMEGNDGVKSVNPVVGETNDGGLNDIRGRHVSRAAVLEAIDKASGGPVEEGNVGAGAGTRCFGFKGGIGTASRKLPAKAGGYTVGVLAQTNFGGVLQIAGVPVGQLLGNYYMKSTVEGSPDGSCMMVVATDAPLDARNLKRLAKRAMLGLARTGGIASNGSGDYVIAFSTHAALRVPYQADGPLQTQEVLHNDFVSPLFLACIEATEEAIVNSLFAAESVHNKIGSADELPVNRVLELMKTWKRLK